MVKCWNWKILRGKLTTNKGWINQLGEELVAVNVPSYFQSDDKYSALRKEREYGPPHCTSLAITQPYSVYACKLPRVETIFNWKAANNYKDRPRVSPIRDLSPTAVICHSVVGCVLPAGMEETNNLSAPINTCVQCPWDPEFVLDTRGRGSSSLPNSHESLSGI